MKNLPLDKKVLINRLAEIEADLRELYKLRDLALDEFLKGYHYPAAEHYLRRALEAVFDIGSHILSRIPTPPGERPETYKEIALKLGEYGIVPKNFSKDSLVKIAGYRNRLIHFYHEVTKEELYQILKDNLTDLEKFCTHIKKLIEKPERFGFKIK